MDLNVLVPVVLFIVLAPGFLLRLPAGGSNTVVTLTHAVVFGLVYAFLRRTFPQYY